MRSGGRQGKAVGTINHGLKIVRRILNLAASEWVDEHGLTWLLTAPKIKLLPDANKRAPYPLNWEEQQRLFRELPDHLAEMALFAVNTGCRDGEVCGLRWDWEVAVPQLGTTVFIIPGASVKNGDERLVVLNRVALSVIEARRGIDPAFVFTYNGRPISSDAHVRLDPGPRPGGPATGAGPRLEAHVRPPPASGRRELRGSPGPARASLRADHDALLGGRAVSAHRGCQSGVRGRQWPARAGGAARFPAEGVPQNSRKAASGVIAYG